MENLKLKHTITENSLQELSSGCKLSEERVRELGDCQWQLRRLRTARTRDTWVGPALWHQVPTGGGRVRRRVFEKQWLQTPQICWKAMTHTPRRLTEFCQGRDITGKILKATDKEKILGTAETATGHLSGHSGEINNLTSQQEAVDNCVHTTQKTPAYLRLLYPATLSSKHEGEMKTSLEEQTLRTALQNSKGRSSGWKPVVPASSQMWYQNQEQTR